MLASTSRLKTSTTKRLTSLTTPRSTPRSTPTTKKTSTRPFLTSSKPVTTTTKSISGTYQADSISLSWKGNSNFTNFTMTNNNMRPGSYFAFGLSFDSFMVNKIFSNT